MKSARPQDWLSPLDPLYAVSIPYMLYATSCMLYALVAYYSSFIYPPLGGVVGFYSKCSMQLVVLMKKAINAGARVLHT